MNAWPTAIEKWSPYWTSAKPWRSRKPALLLVTAMVPGVAPLKSISKYPEMLRNRASVNGASTRIERREDCAVNRVSETLPANVSSYGMVPKFVPGPPPLLVDR